MQGGRVVVVLELLTNVVTVYKSLYDFAANANVCLATSHNWVNRENMPVLPGFIHDEISGGYKTVARGR